MSAAMQSSGRPTWRQNLAHALTAAVLTAVVVTPIFGLHLERAGMRTYLCSSCGAQLTSDATTAIPSSSQKI